MQNRKNNTPTPSDEEILNPMLSIQRNTAVQREQNANFRKKEVIFFTLGLLLVYSMLSLDKQSREEGKDKSLSLSFIMACASLASLLGLGGYYARSLSIFVRQSFARLDENIRTVTMQNNDTLQTTRARGVG